MTSNKVKRWCHGLFEVTHGMTRRIPGANGTDDGVVLRASISSSTALVA